MATTRSKKSGESKPVEKKQVEAPKTKEVKEAPKPVEKKVEAPKAKEVKEAPKVAAKKLSKNREISIDDIVISKGRKFKVLSLNENFADLSLLEKPHKRFQISIRKLELSE